MALATAQGALTLVGVNNTTLHVFWKGRHLAEVRHVHLLSDEDSRTVRLRVDNTTTYDEAYAEMRAAGIKIKKGA